MEWWSRLRRYLRGVSKFVIPALVAALVTLVIEYFAKPQLEARKERITERHRIRRETRSHFRLLSYHFGRLLVYAQRGDDDVLDAMRGLRFQEVLDPLRNHTDALRDALARQEGMDDTIAEDSLLECIAASEALLLLYDSGREEQADQFAIRIVDPLFDLAADAGSTTWWRPVRRRRLRTQLSGLLASSKGDEGTAGSGEGVERG